MADIWVDVDTALASIPVNILPLTDDTDYKSKETAVAYNAAGMALQWNFVTTGGVQTATSVTPTTSGTYDWAHAAGAMYTIEMPASGGASINNDTEGFGWFTGSATGVLPWRGPVIGFRASGLNDKLIDSAYDAFRALAGTALPGVAAEGAGGLLTRGSGAGQVNQNANGQVDVRIVTAAANGIPAGAHAAAELNAIADAYLDRNMATGTDSGTNSTAVRTPRQAHRELRNKVVIAGGVKTTYKEDDATTSHTAAVTTTAGDPLSAIDPT
jgi:hypothetical protein